MRSQLADFFVTLKKALNICILISPFLKTLVFSAAAHKDSACNKEYYPYRKSDKIVRHSVVEAVAAHNVEAVADKPYGVDSVE